jgi:putative ABC transport system ATP-binding protein
MIGKEEPLVIIKNLNKSYRRGNQSVPVLRDITVDIAENEFLALMGPSGSGKSTLLNLIAGIDRADSGSIRIGGVDIAALEMELPAGGDPCGFIFQFYNLIPFSPLLKMWNCPFTTRLTRPSTDHVKTRLSLEPQP